jgi:hypothetical protein
MARLACFALACQLVLSFGHVHSVRGDGLWSGLPSHSTAASDQPSGNKPIGLADDYCAICSNASLVGTLVIPAAPAIDVAFSAVRKLPWPVAEMEPVRFRQFRFLARGPPQA